MYHKKLQVAFDRVQDVIPPNGAPRHAEYLKRKGFEKCRCYKDAL